MLRRRRLVLTLAVAVAGVALTGCAPAATPTPTPSPHFTSEAQAFKAAEATYRAYVDATNAVVLSDPKTFEPVYQWETGEALGTEKKSLTSMYSRGWSTSGDTEPGPIEYVSFSPRDIVVVRLHVCMDVSRVVVRDAGGKSLVRDERPDFQPLVVNFERSTTSPTGLKISGMPGGDFNCAQ